MSDYDIYLESEHQGDSYHLPSFASKNLKLQGNWGNNWENGRNS